MMKRFFAWILFVGLLCQSTICAQSMMRIDDKAYDLEVRDMYVRTSSNGKYRVLKTEKTTGVLRSVNSIELQYDFETQRKECIGRYEEDAPLALVTVHGFDEQLAMLGEDEVVITVNGQPIRVDESSDADGHVGWKDPLHEGTGMGVVFPIVLTKQGGRLDYIVRVQGVKDDVHILETARIQVKLVNTHAYKEEKQAGILHLESEDAEVYIVGDTIYVDHPMNRSDETTLTMRFCDEAGKPFDCITWAEGTLCAEEGSQAALYLKQEIRLDEDSEAEYALASGCAQARREKVRFVLETKEALYKTVEYRIVERFDVKKQDPKGIYFAKTEQLLQVGQVFEPVVLGVKTNEVLRSGVFGKLSIAAGEHTDAQVIDVSDGKTVIAVKPGAAYITARYDTAENTYVSASMKIVVTENSVQEMTVLCRNLNVRAGAGLEAAKVGMLHRGDNVQVLCVKDGWAQLADGSYVSAQYIG